MLVVVLSSVHFTHATSQSSQTISSYGAVSSPNLQIIPRWLKEFHSGFGGKGRFFEGWLFPTDTCLVACPSWGCALGPNGELQHLDGESWGWWINSSPEKEDFERMLSAILDRGYELVLREWVHNFESLDEAMVSGFLTYLSNWLSTNYPGKVIIWMPCWEYNQPENHRWIAECTKGAVRSNWYIEPDDFNRIMPIIRQVRDNLGITNVLLSASLNCMYAGSWRYYWDSKTWEQGRDLVIAPYLEGLQQLDVVGANAYLNNEDWSYIDKVFDWLRRTYEYVDPTMTKPFVLMEFNTAYGVDSAWPRDGSQAHVEYCYNKLSTNSWCKGFCWFGDMTDKLLNAVKTVAPQYEGYGG